MWCKFLKCIRKQIYQWHKVGHGQPRIIIWPNLVGPTSPCYIPGLKVMGLLVLEKILEGFSIYGHVGHLGHVTRTICVIFCQLVVRSLNMKIQSNWPYVLIYWWDSNISDLGWKVKGQPWPLELIYRHCQVRLNISSKINDFGCNSFKKSTFQKKIHLNA